MTEEDEDDPDSIVFHSSSVDSKPQIIEDIGKIVSKLLNSRIFGSDNSEPINRMIETTQDISPNPHFFLVESGNPNIHIDFSKAKEIIDSIKALISIHKIIPNKLNPELYNLPMYGQIPEFKEYSVDTLSEEEIVPEENTEQEEPEQTYLSDSKYISEEFL